jgi:hypothetical protein|tara:strand:- start:335 stop:463 length:129 start_codon:yes stop_codon:yes gene_type:complete
MKPPVKSILQRSEQGLPNQRRFQNVTLFELLVLIGERNDRPD